MKYWIYYWQKKKKMNRVELSLKWKKREIPNLDHPTQTPYELMELKDNKCKLTAIIKKSMASNKTKYPNPKEIKGLPKPTRVSAKAVVLLPGFFTNNSKLPVEDKDPLNNIITSKICNRQ
jgi:hypothetical protein